MQCALSAAGGLLLHLDHIMLCSWSCMGVRLAQSQDSPRSVVDFIDAPGLLTLCWCLEPRLLAVPRMCWTCGHNMICLHEVSIPDASGHDWLRAGGSWQLAESYTWMGGLAWPGLACCCWMSGLRVVTPAWRAWAPR